MDSRRSLAALVVAVVGLGLIIVEAVQTLRGESLGTLGAILLYGGLGLFVIGAAVVIADPTDDTDPVEPTATTA